MEEDLLSHLLPLVSFSAQDVAFDQRKKIGESSLGEAHFLGDVCRSHGSDLSASRGPVLDDTVRSRTVRSRTPTDSDAWWISKSVGGASDALTAGLENVGLDHDRAHVLMTQEFLDGRGVVAVPSGRP